MTKLNYAEYKETGGMFAQMGKPEFVKYTVRRNLRPSVFAPRGRSINGGNVGNRHALKHGIRMWDHNGCVIARGSSAVKRHEYSPDF